MIVPILLILVGFVLLIKGADWMVSGSSALAKKNNISNIAIGLTIVAFGTSTPELVVNSFASFQGHSDIVFGNVIGSNNFNLFIILGIVGLISPIVVQSNTVWKEIPLSLFAVVILYLLCNSFFFQETAVLTRLDGLVLIVMFGLFLFYVYKQLKTETLVPEIAIIPMSTRKIWSLIFIGLSGLVLGGKLVVDNAVEVASSMGVSEKIIGLTIVAAGTSLPELVTSVVAVMRKNNDIAIGNIIGSNIFNIFLILSVSSFIRPIEFAPLFNTDLYILAGGTIFLFIAMFTGVKKKLDRWEAALLLVSYLAYTVYLIGKEV
ncbi:calcium/sodium antiporter [Labilibaculum euxinus]|uniref:Calcium/sodium antiporter n=1 Tax=Labilibaculum euxinus TaxID=2686357 RepID=A0A7M4D546_9BACT|nr:calcium/sodium antiporter [Labilibaculum euxinus]MUP37775.1 calcium/sodium antiporter [Labilibaculum euxinus]MVB06980.1 calcium/sodium antiporter [Labilibaculum euxinus]